MTRTQATLGILESLHEGPLAHVLEKLMSAYVLERAHVQKMTRETQVHASLARQCCQLHFTLTRHHASAQNEEAQEEAAAAAGRKTLQGKWRVVTPPHILS